MFPSISDMMNFNELENFIEEYDMLPEGGRVLCAVSGGADSMCLLHIMCSRKNIAVACAHFNHCLRGAESDRDEQFVRRVCAELGVECFTDERDVAAYAKSNSMGTEEAARKLRYDFLFAVADSWGADRIATAHNADDNAETVILNLARGAGLKGLCGIPPVRGRIIRPLLHTTREEIEQYLAEHGLEHVEDSSNAADDYSRNRIRHHIIPVLRMQNPDAVRSIARTTQLLRKDEEYLSHQAERFIKEHLDTENGLPVRYLRELPESVMMRVFRIMCGAALSSGHADAIGELCMGDAVHAYADVPGMRVAREFDRLVFGSEMPQPLPERELVCGKITSFPEINADISCVSVDNCREINNSFNTFCFKSETICGRITVASRRDGARIELAGRGCRKSLKKLFSEAGMPLSKRLTTPVFYDEQGVIAVYGFGIAERCVPQTGDNIIKIEVMCKDGRG